MRNDSPVEAVEPELQNGREVDGAKRRDGDKTHDRKKDDAVLKLAETRKIIDQERHISLAEGLSARMSKADGDEDASEGEEEHVEELGAKWGGGLRVRT